MWQNIVKHGGALCHVDRKEHKTIEALLKVSRINVGDLCDTQQSNSDLKTEPNKCQTSLAECTGTFVFQKAYVKKRIPESIEMVLCLYCVALGSRLQTTIWGSSEALRLCCSTIDDDVLVSLPTRERAC